MITGCPSCATRYDLPVRYTGGHDRVCRCPGCGHSWLEANAVEIVEARIDSPITIEHGHDLDAEARRLAEAAKLAAQRHQERRRRRVAAVRGWAILTLAVVLPLAGAMAFPESVTRAAPAAARIYSLAGIEVNVAGFMIRDAAGELQQVSGTPLLAVRGQIVNVANRPQQVPTLRFVLHGESGEAYEWTLNGSGTRQLAPGESTGFLTRVAAPPGGAREVEIRFARTP